MKKLLVLFGALAIATSVSYASLDEASTSDVNVLREQGYSETMLHMVDLTNSQQGTNQYVRHFGAKKHKGLGKAYTRLKLYVDPSQDDGKFGEHQVNFSNNWLNDFHTPEYAKSIQEIQPIENL